jgi:hypothetical protein
VGGVGGVWHVGCVGCVGVWGFGGCGVLSCGVTPYVRHSTDCTCCDFGHLRFLVMGTIIRILDKKNHFFFKFQN